MLLLYQRVFKDFRQQARAKARNGKFTIDSKPGVNVPLCWNCLCERNEKPNSHLQKAISTFIALLFIAHPGTFLKKKAECCWDSIREVGNYLGHGIFKTSNFVYMPAKTREKDFRALVPTFMPVEVAAWILQFTHGSIEPHDHDRLDNWVEASLENQALFEMLIDKLPMNKIPDCE